jgi:hypothetical protein
MYLQAHDGFKKPGSRCYPVAHVVLHGLGDLYALQGKLDEVSAGLEPIREDVGPPTYTNTTRCQKATACFREAVQAG